MKSLLIQFGGNLGTPNVLILYLHNGLPRGAVACLIFCTLLFTKENQILEFIITHRSVHTLYFHFFERKCFVLFTQISTKLSNE